MRQEREVVRVVRADGGWWRVEVAGAAVADTMYGTQEEATRVARDLARETRRKLLIHSRNGTLRQVVDYGGGRLTL